MTERQFWKLIKEIQTFMWLDNWIITYEITELEQGIDGQCVNILYSYFKAHIEFNKSLIGNDKDYIIHVIFHELSHIYTTQAIEIYENESDFIQGSMWNNSYIHIKEKMNIVNEQQTELLARRFKELYLKN